MNVAPETLDRLARLGFAKRAPVKGYFDLFASIKLYIDHLQEESAGRKSSDGSHDVAAESAQLKRIQRERIALDMAERSKVLVPLAKVREQWGAMIVDAQFFRSRLAFKGSFPTWCASEVDTMKGIVRDVLKEIAGIKDPPTP